MLNYQCENWMDAKHKMKWLWSLHDQEYNRLRPYKAMQLNMPVYDQAAENGMLFVVTATSGDKVVGYYYAFIQNHLHHVDSVVAITDTYYLHPDWRKGRNGIRLFQYVKRCLKALGVERIFLNARKDDDKSRIFRYLGYQETDTVFTLYLGDD